MEFFSRNDNGSMMAEDVSVSFLARQYGTPLYVYSEKALREHFSEFEQSAGDFPHLICYAVKANSNLSILRLMASLGAGFDIVSGGELARVIKAGGDPAKVVYSGVAKTESEISAALNAGILSFNVESEAEMERISRVAVSGNTTARISVRVNPDVDAGTHPYISTGLKTNKFGVPVERAFNLYKRALELPGIKIVGIDCHIGSQLTSLAPFEDALDRIVMLITRLKNEGIVLEHIDVGGGLGVVYNDEVPPSRKSYMDVIINKIRGLNIQLICEPGRSMVANAGILVSRCEYLKEGETVNFCIVDTAMNDMIRPSLYQAWMKIEEAEMNQNASDAVYNVVGPVCETGDFLGKDRHLQVAAGDYLVMQGAGAYGFSMSSNYNSRPRACEVMVSGSDHRIIRKRETIEDLWRGEEL
ncbi:diaminopimelate decarboxylase [Succinimonas amylolytica]|uniref:diaminopimelate decarboxylase n=1 Tax=Succinimonas amylolytica TaxID=83769 RepID=UPI0023A80956